MELRGKAWEGRPCSDHREHHIETHGDVHPSREEEVRNAHLDRRSDLLDEEAEAFDENEVVEVPCSGHEEEADPRLHGTHSGDAVEVLVVLRASQALHMGPYLGRDIDPVGIDLRYDCLKNSFWTWLVSWMLGLWG